jgi:hypothetical protein
MDFGNLAGGIYSASLHEFYCSLLLVASPDLYIGPLDGT